ncbi:alpha-1,6-mannosyltransferase [Kytococcus aerolatus]|uniref:D-inositol 3-phosphate glycosyltransferase n=1 Tax=Kytococcus aerolatus TaxID=592308 RepID=A0A212U2H3_9MICO|nr:glycosyltransferase [Kytococcus aerolatus]SNC72448.1 alpha-1,6-mannosyltransferase [Kytococcus aerolatus]
MRIVRVANFVSPSSGGIRTALRHWGERYRELGHEVHLVIPDPEEGTSERTPPVLEPQGWVHHVPATPAGAGYRLMWARTPVARLLRGLQPDRLEVHDRSTLRWVGPWARRHGIPTMMLSHENMTGILIRRLHTPERLAEITADFINGKSAADFDRIACPSHYAAAEWRRFGADARVVTLGVDLESFQPPTGPSELTPDGRPRPAGQVQLVHCGRLSPEKNPGLSIAAVRELIARGHDVHLTVLGHGPMRDDLRAEAADLPALFHEYISGRKELAEVLGRADLAISPGPVETFGLAALEALACGVPVVCPDEGALAEVVGAAGAVAPSTGPQFADAVLEVLARGDLTEVAREQAERFNWEDSTAQMLAIHAELGPID